MSWVANIEEESLLIGLQAMAEAGYKITIVGHSLGSGCAAILTYLLKDSGVDNVRCYAFATPNCVDLPLAERCAEEGLVTSVVFRDDIVARFSPEALANLLKELKAFDLDAALKKVQQLHFPLPASRLTLI